MTKKLSYANSHPFQRLMMERLSPSLSPPPSSFSEVKSRRIITHLRGKKQGSRVCCINIFPDVIFSAGLWLFPVGWSPTPRRKSFRLHKCQIVSWFSRVFLPVLAQGFSCGEIVSCAMRVRVRLEVRLGNWLRMTIPVSVWQMLGKEREVGNEQLRSKTQEKTKKRVWS